MQRVMIVGQPGAGKSTLAQLLGDRTGLPVVHVDLIHWMDGWVERDKPQKVQMAMAKQAEDRWIFEGGLSATWEDRLARADTLIVLDFPLWLRLWRVIRRTIRHYGQSRPDLPDGCPERLDPEFFRWIWDTRHTGKVKMLKMAKQTPDKAIVLRSPRQVRQYLAGLDMAASSGHDPAHGTL